jgi:lysophospholipase L1-like esterase
VQVSPPDAEGNHSFGLISDFVHEAVTRARTVIAEVNECGRFTYGDSGDHLHPNDAGYAVMAKAVEPKMLR